MPVKMDVSGQIQQLLDERQRHTDALAAIEQILGPIRAMLAGSTNGHKPGRQLKALPSKSEPAGAAPSNSGTPKTLADHLEAVMRTAGQPMVISDLTAGVKSAGYKSKSKDFRPVVSLALIKDGRFKRAGRGVYTLR